MKEEHLTTKPVRLICQANHVVAWIGGPNGEHQAHTTEDKTPVRGERILFISVHPRSHALG